MKDKEIKGWKERLRFSYGHLYHLNEDNEFCKIVNEIDDLEEFISNVEQEAERRGFGKGRKYETLSKYNEIDLLSEERKREFEELKLLEEEK